VQESIVSFISRSAASNTSALRIVIADNTGVFTDANVTIELREPGDAFFLTAASKIKVILATGAADAGINFVVALTQLGQVVTNF
jgi:hypothetical protein